MNALLPHKLFVEIGDVFLQQTDWSKETLDALVLIRRMRPGQEVEAAFCHDQIVRTLDHWYRTAGFCYDQFPPLLLHLSNYLMAAGYKRCDGVWLPPAQVVA